MAKKNKRKQNEIEIVFNSIIISRIRYGISTYGSDTRALAKIDKFLEKCFEKRYCTKRHNAYNILHEEDSRLAINIVTNPNHPLHTYLTKPQKHRQTRHKFTSTKPYTKTLTYLRSFCNRVLPLK